jgi:hypothetical protein
VEGVTRLAQGEIQRRAVEGPAPVQPRDVAVLGLGAEEEIEGVDVVTQFSQGPMSRQVRQPSGRACGPEGALVVGGVHDVLADSVLAVAAQAHDRGQPLKAA